MPASPMRPASSLAASSSSSSSASLSSGSSAPSSPRQQQQHRRAASQENGLLHLPSSSATTSGAGLASGGFGGAAGSSMVSGLTMISNTLKDEASHDPFLRMMNAGTEVDADGLLLGAEKGDLAAVERALAAGVDPNKVAGRNGFTPLHHAVQRGHLAVAGALLRRGRAGVDAATSDALETPLHMAAFHGHLELATLLLDCGADPNARDSDGETPLFSVARRGKSPALAALLLSRRADPALRNRYNDLAADDIRASDEATRAAFDEDAQRREAKKAASAASASAVAAGPGGSTHHHQPGDVPRRKGSASSVPAISGAMGVLKLSLVVRCLRFLTVRDWGSANAVCKGWRKAARHPKLVKKFTSPAAAADAPTAALAKLSLGNNASRIQASNVDEAEDAASSRPPSN